jgi:formylglycine-generating enzyme required for sulfatase activity/tRNA A-37 threonylcarbamoyl transferase component Bud32
MLGGFLVRGAAMPPPPAADRNLLFGILALQMDFVSRDALIAAMNAWVLDKAKPLGQILCDQGALPVEQRTLLDALVYEHLKNHGNDPETSLAAVSSIRSLRHDLRQIADADVQASLAHVAAPADTDPYATRPEYGPTAAGPRFRILRPHAKGGLGEVFVAQDEELHREVALKEIQARHADHAESRARFLLEAEVTGGLEHPGIVPVYGLGTYADGRPFYAMRFIRGDSLKDAVERFHKEKASLPAGERALRLRQLLGRFVDVCQAIAYAHSRGVLHRDLKPGNVMLGKYGETLVVDWGLAKVLDRADPEATEAPLQPTLSGDSARTQTGAALGTPAYMSPEQAAGRLDQLGPRSDVYSLGATLHCVLTGQAPFPSGDAGEVLGKVQRGDYPRPRALDRQLHPALEAICRQAMALRPEDRYPSPQALAEDLEKYLADEPVTAYREPLPARLARWRRRHSTLVAVAAFVVLTLVGAAVVGDLVVGREQAKTLHEQQAKLEEQRKARAAQVGTLLDVAPQAVPAVLAALAPHRDEIRPLLRQAAEQPEPREVTAEATRLWRQHRARAGLALLAEDPGQVGPLTARLREEGLDPAEMLLVRDALRPHAAALTDDLWRRAGEGTPAGRFRALVALAAYDPGAPRWGQAAAGAVGELLAANPLYLGQWVEALRPVRDQLIPPLGRVFRGAEPELADYRQVAASVLADYAADDPHVLADLLVDADAEQFAVLYPNLQRLGDRALPPLTGAVDRKLPAEAKDDDKEQLAKRQANAAVALLRLNQADKVWPLLQHRPDPRVRSYLVHRFGPLGADAGALVKRLAEEPDVTIRRALLLSLGEFGEEAWAPEAKKRLVEQVQEVYRTAADPGLHASAEWLLRQWQEEAWLVQTGAAWARDKEQRDKRLEGIRQEFRRAKEKAPPQWYVNGQGQTMAVIPGPVEFLMGSPATEADHRYEEVLHRQRIGRSFAIAATPVTKEQFLHFLPKFSHPEMKRYPELTCPIGGVVWYEAAAYCNWLSDQEGIPRDQWCYETNARGQVTKLKENYLSLTGYRLPTEAEWEYACRAGAVTSRYYGETADLLDQYGWYSTNAHERTWPVGGKKPNDLGLFDLHGNVYTWCQESYRDYSEGKTPLLALGASSVGLLGSPCGPGPLLAVSGLAPGRPAVKGDEAIEDTEDILSIDPNKSRVLRGGSFNSPASNLRCGNRNRNVPTYRSHNVGLRPARTFR